MPTYDYICRACGHEMELFQSMSDKPKRKCPECGAMKLERLIGTGAAVIFKGGGFYEPDYRSESYKNGSAAEKKAKESKADSGSADTKSEKKTETKAKKSDAKPAASKSEKSSPGNKSK